MKGLAAWIMKGRTQAASAASLFLVLALIVTPSGLFSAAVIGLVTLRLGAREGVWVAFLSTLVSAVLGGLLFGQPLALPVAGLALWVPMMGLALVLRTTRSLRLAVEAAVVAAALLVVVQHLMLDDVTAHWKGVLSDYAQQILDPAVVSEAERRMMVDQLAPWMAGGLAAAWLVQSLLALFLARGWQALLYNPGGFATEFRSLRLGRWLLVVVPLLLLAGMAEDRPGLAGQTALVGMTAFLFQGVAAVHGLVARSKNGGLWLAGFYFMLVIGMPASFTLVSAFGFADGLIDFRTRVRSRGSGNGDE